MSDYTPTTNEILATYMRYRGAWNLANGSEAQFDRWLEQVKAEAWDEGYSASEKQWEHIYDGHPVREGEMCPECSAGNPYRQGQSA